MTFYILPPEGFVSLKKFENLVLVRIKFLKEILEQINKSKSYNNLATAELKAVLDQTASHSDCLIEGTRADRISHFILRLLCSTDKDSRSFLLRAECALFRHRVSCMNHKELRRMVRRLNDTLGSNGSGKSSIHRKDLDLLFGALTHGHSWSELIRGFKRRDNNHFVKVPWYLVCSLVASRDVTITQGIAFVPYAKLDYLLFSLFTSHLSHCLDIAAKAAEKAIAEDNRIKKMTYFVQAYVGRHLNTKHSCSPLPRTISKSDIEEITQSFPLCMRHIHQSLVDYHRLPHHARIQYSLFLKELGLPLHEAIAFWSEHYSQDAANGATYGEHWRSGERRYTYNIRHLYGLEGARRNYTAHSCSAIQHQSLHSGQCGGCPFRHFDENNLTLILRQSVDDNSEVQSIVAQSANGCYKDACLAYLSFTVKQQLKRSDTKAAIPLVISLNEQFPVANMARNGEKQDMKEENNDGKHLDESGYFTQMSDFNPQAASMKEEKLSQPNVSSNISLMSDNFKLHQATTAYGTRKESHTMRLIRDTYKTNIKTCAVHSSEIEYSATNAIRPVSHKQCEDRNYQISNDIKSACKRKLCSSSCDTALQTDCKRQRIDMKSIILRKPSDFYDSYLKLLNSLKSFESNT